MRIFDRYGIAEISAIDEIAQYLSAILDIQWIPRHSEYRGDYYKCKKSDGETFTLMENYDARDAEYRLPDHSNQNLLLYVSDTSRAKEIEDKLLASKIKITLLRRRTEKELEQMKDSSNN